VPFLLIGIAAHIDSFCAAKLVKCEWVHAATWRRHYIGSMPRGTKRPRAQGLRRAPVPRARHDARNDDEADACGILDHDHAPRRRHAAVARGGHFADARAVA
jgi:hypothetical protein